MLVTCDTENVQRKCTQQKYVVKEKSPQYVNCKLKKVNCKLRKDD